MLIRFTAALMFTLAGAAVGMYFSAELRSSRDICRDIEDLLRNAALQIRYRGLNVYELMSLLKEKSVHLDFLSEISDMYVLGQNFHDSWETALKKQHDIPDEERALLMKLGQMLGTTDIDGQLASIAALEEELRLLRKRREENYYRKGRLFRCVGVLLGAMTGILVI